MLKKYVSLARVESPQLREVNVRNPATGRQCYGGMKPVDMIENFEPSAPLPPPEPIPPQVSRRAALELLKTKKSEEPAK